MPIKIHILVDSQQSLGGGLTFIRNFTTAGKKFFEFTDEDNADVILLPGASLMNRDSVERVKNKNKKIVLRIDNALKNSRNRNTGSSRLYDFAQMADLVIFQSNWAREYLSPFIKKDGVVIINGADENIFKPEGEKIEKDGNPVYLYVRYNLDETKHWHQVWYEYQMVYRQNNEAMLWLVGRWPGEVIQYNFDFFMGERYRYFGVIEDPREMAKIYRSADVLIAPYYYDACSNVIIEAKLCGCKLMVNNTGGNPDILKAKKEELTATHMAYRYYEEIKKIL